ncbi:MAG: hypothetical protein K5931_08680 [Lachnospiraceae bacterium]|nr:hypothetical protein [Lachnospiraceae bacterium]
MKYCKKCGMLLEDTQDICIGCGRDVSDPESTSEFPPELEEEIKSQKEKEKAKNGLIIAIIAVLVLLAALIGIIVVQVSKNAPVEEEAEELEEESEEEALEEEPIESEGELKEEEASESSKAEEPVDNREVSDDLGSYYLVGNVYDAMGNLMFSTLYPEEFGSIEANFDYEKYSDLFPMVMTCVVSNEDNTLRLTYSSPQHFWYQNSTKGKSRTNEADLDYYMSFLSYDGPQSYIEALIKQAYAGAKKVELVETKEASESVRESLNLLIKEKTKKLTGDIGDYAHIGDATTYATGESGSDASIFKYHILDASGKDVFCDFFVPVIYNTFYYANDQIGDQGSVTEWMPLCVITYESGNQETYEFYEDAFTVFVNNSVASKEFFRVNEEYGRMIKEAVSAKTTPPVMDEALLSTITETIKSNTKLSDTNSEIYNFLSTPDKELKTFSNTAHRVTGPADSKQAFYSETKNSVFITPSETEYPGKEYVDLLEE